MSLTCGLKPRVQLSYNTHQGNFHLPTPRITQSAQCLRAAALETNLGGLSLPTNENCYVGPCSRPERMTRRCALALPTAEATTTCGAIRPSFLDVHIWPGTSSRLLEYAHANS